MLNRDLQDMLDLFFENPSWFEYKDLQINLINAGMNPQLKVVKSLINVYPFGKAIYDKRNYAHPIIFDISFVNGGHFDAIKLILKDFYPETNVMSQDEIDDFVMHNFEFLGGANGTLLNLYDFKDKRFEEQHIEWNKLTKDAKNWWKVYNFSNGE